MTFKNVHTKKLFVFFICVNLALNVTMLETTNEMCSIKRTTLSLRLRKQLNLNVLFFFIGPSYTNIRTSCRAWNKGDLPPGIGAQTRPL